MFQICVEKQCGCFKKSDLLAEQQVSNKEEAIEIAQKMCDTMNQEFCQKHEFELDEKENEIIITMDIKNHD